MRRGVDWHSPNVDHSAGLYVGYLVWGWRPAGYDAATDRHRGRPGWIIARYAGGNPVLNEWWPRIAVNRAWEGLIVPLWIPLATFAIPTAILLYRDYRRPSGRCLRCGYDLRASKDKCPECGTKIQGEQASERKSTTG